MDTIRSFRADSGEYRITVHGHIDQSWSTSFDGLKFATGFREDRPVTCLAGRFIDQAALHGALARIQEIGLKLISVEHVGSPAD